MRHIIHADLDAFYATVEQLDNPELRGKPVLVGGRPENRGVVATASYEARPFGVHSAMPMRTAVRLCPQGIIVPPRFTRYRDMSRQVMDVFREFTEVIQPLSLDEAYLDISEAVDEGEGRWPLGVALELKRRVKEETGLTVSVGVSTCKSVSKIASDMDKPDGLVVVPPGEEAGFLAPLPVGKLWGIGPKTAERLKAEGVDTIGALAEQSPEWFHTGVRAESGGGAAAGRRTRRRAGGNRADHQVGLIRDHLPRRHRRRGRAATGAGGTGEGRGRCPGPQGATGTHRHGKDAPGRLHHVHPADNPARPVQ